MFDVTKKNPDINEDSFNAFTKSIAEFIRHSPEFIKGEVNKFVFDLFRFPVKFNHFFPAVSKFVMNCKNIEHKYTKLYRERLIQTTI